MRTSTVLILGGVGVLGFLLWKRSQTPAASVPVIPPGTSALDALTTGLEAGIAAGTYDASALRNAMVDAHLAASGGIA